MCGNAAATLAVGACAWDGGFVDFGPTGAVGVQDAVPDADVVNLGGCPHNAANTVAVLVHYLTFGEMPALDRYNRPLFAYGDTIHDQCERRAYYDAGLFVEEWGDEGHRKGYCLYKMGCKGPSATYNCPNVRWNDGTSWPVQAGHGCIGCAAPQFWSQMTPFYGRLPDVSGFGVDTTAEKVGLAAVVAVAGASAAHGLGKVVQHAGEHGRGEPGPEPPGDRAEPGPEPPGDRADPPPPPPTRRPRRTPVRIKVDPVTRIEGHLRLEAEVADGHVRTAWASGTMFRGLEIILRDRDPREAWIWAQRICGVCTTVHALASVRAVENALEIQVPPNAELVRNLIAGTQTVHDHVIHFYHLHALDWVDVTQALKADPAKAARIGRSLSDWPGSGVEDLRTVQARVRALVDSGQLSVFASGYWGHPAYRLPPEVNLLAVAHYLQALEWQRDVIRVHAVLGGKNPHPQTYLVGGMATPLDLNSPQAINLERIGFMRARLRTMREFVEQVYLPDVLAIAGAYRDWFAIGGNTRDFLAYGGMPEGSLAEPARYLFPRGIVMDRDLGTVHPFDEAKVTEQVAHSWYRYADGDRAALNPFEGETEPNYTGPKPPYEWLETDGKYSWLKSPRYDGRRDGGRPAGPHARRLRVRRRRRPAQGRRDAQAAERRARGALLDAGPRRGAGDRDADPRRAPRRLDGPARGEHARGRPAHRRHVAVGPRQLAQGGAGLGLARAAARGARPLGRHPRPQDRQLPGRRPDDVELGPAGRRRPTGALRAGARRRAGGRPRAAARAPADRPLLRPVHGVRGARARRAPRRPHAGRLTWRRSRRRPQSAARRSRPAATRRSTAPASAPSTSGSGRCGSPTG